MVNLYSLLYCEKFDKRCQWLRCSPPPLSFRHCLGEILYTFLNALEKWSWFGYPTAFPMSATDKSVSFKSSAALVMR